MKSNIPFVPLAATVLVFVITQAQAQDPSSLVRPRTVGGATQKAPVSNPPKTQMQQTPVKPSHQVVTTTPTSNTPQTKVQQTPINPSLPVVTTAPPETNIGATGSENKSVALPVTQFLAPAVIQSRITEAERLLKSRPLTTASTPSIEFVTIAALDAVASRTHLVTLSKETFLTKGAEITLSSSLGTPLNVRVLRANGVNTAVSIFDPTGRALVPLVVEFPIEKRGLFREMAYYTSAHPALLTKALSLSGQLYIRSMIDLAAKRLRDRGAFVSPEIVNVAERLCVVEHVDHDRFKQENRLALYDEIYSLYALNQLDTYRYSVSSAGAGGMVQMIPWAYNLERERHPGVGLIPDFVTGMRNHGNALQAMLLYMQDTWNELSANEDVKYALNAKLATTSELLAAGYNSNAAKLPSYIRPGGDSCKVLIPR